MKNSKHENPEKAKVSIETPKMEARITIELPLDDYNYFDCLCHFKNTTIADVIMDAISSYIAKGKEETKEAYRKDLQAKANLEEFTDPLSNVLLDTIDSLCEESGMDRPDATGWTLGQFFNWVDQLPVHTN